MASERRSTPKAREAAHGAPAPQPAHAAAPTGSAALQNAGTAAVGRIAGKAIIFTSHDMSKNWLANKVYIGSELVVEQAEAAYFRSRGYEVEETDDIATFRDAVRDPNVRAVAVSSHGDANAMMDMDNQILDVGPSSADGRDPTPKLLSLTKDKSGFTPLHLDELIADGCDTADDSGKNGLHQASGAKMFMGNVGKSDPFGELHFALRLAAASLTHGSPAIEDVTDHAHAAKFVAAHPDLPAWLKKLIAP